MLLDRDLTIQEMFFNKAIEITPIAEFEVGGIAASSTLPKVETISMDLEATQFHAKSDLLEKLAQHFGKNWGWYAGAAAIGIVAYYSLRPKEKITKPDGFKSINEFFPFPNFSTPPIKIDTKPIASIRKYIDEAKSKQINTH